VFILETSHRTIGQAQISSERRSTSRASPNASVAFPKSQRSFSSVAGAA